MSDKPGGNVENEKGSGSDHLVVTDVTRGEMVSGRVNFEMTVEGRDPVTLSLTLAAADVIVQMAARMIMASKGKPPGRPTGH